MDRITCIEDLLEEPHNHDPKTLLLSLGAALGHNILMDHLDYISGVEDWRFKVDKNGNVTDSEKEIEE